MALSDFEFNGSYNRIDNDIAEEFYLPCMRNSIIYNRISGYFGSTVYIIAWDALKKFIENRGTIRLICSPYLSQDDFDAMQEGDSAKNNEVLSQALERELCDLLQSEDLELPARLLACLISREILQIKIAIVRDEAHPGLKSLFHDKIGIFIDKEKNAVGFRGSFNETFKGLSNDGNIESTDVFQSWDGGKDSVRVEDALNIFERVWNGQVGKGIRVFDIPNAARERINESAHNYRWEELLEEIQVNRKKSSKWKPSSRSNSPREHQIKALENWVNKGRRGILKHATGSGKTFTAICAIKNALDQNETVLIFVPSKELLYHWKREIEKNIIDSDIRYLLCGDGNTSWKNNGELSSWSSASDSIHKVIIAMMSTAGNDDFISNIAGGSHLFIIADEVHRLGSIKRRTIFAIESGARLGLSATPERYGDEIGTAAIFDYFGGIVPPVFSLKDAIDCGVLTRYFYYTEKVYLAPNEQEEWNAISVEISRIIARHTVGGTITNDLFSSNTRLSQLAIARARILKNASDKIDKALDILKQNYKRGQRWIVYCDNIKQLHAVRIRAEHAGFDAYEYYADMSGDRDVTLDYFAKHGGVLVSIKCLDEGVDIPSTTHALILASSKNPREFIQRRGRILRKSTGKTFAYLYDVVVLPAINAGEQEQDKTLSIVLGELARAIQFGSWAENPSCITDLKLISLDYGVDYHDYEDRGVESDE